MSVQCPCGNTRALYYNKKSRVRLDSGEQGWYSHKDIDLEFNPLFAAIRSYEYIGKYYSRSVYCF